MSDDKRHICDPTLPERARYRFRHALNMGDFGAALAELRSARAFVTRTDLAHEADAFAAWFARRHEIRRPHDTTPDEERMHIRLED